jgi:hypothetical protein
MFCSGCSHFRPGGFCSLDFLHGGLKTGFRIRITLMQMRIRIQLFTLMRIRIQLFYFIPDPVRAPHQGDANLPPTAPFLASKSREF